MLKGSVSVLAMLALLEFAGTGEARADDRMQASPVNDGAATQAKSDQVAQPPSSEDPQAIADIIVTALRRSERLQEAPAAISAISADTIKAAGIGSLNDVSRVVPALRFEGGVRPGVPSIAIRGISAGQGADAPVSILIDGVQVPFLSFAKQDLLDISSVELLRGPQGALYGRGAIAGALIINTRQPDEELRLTGQFSAQQGNDYKGVLTVSGPLAGDVLTGKLTAAYQNRDGLLRYVNRSDHGDFVDEGNVQAELLFRPGPDTRIAFTGSMRRGTEGTNLLELVPVAVPGSMKDFKIYTLQQNYRNYDKRRLWNAAVKADQTTSFGTFTLVAQHARARDIVVNDFDYTGAPLRINYNPELDEATNLDARFSSPADRPISWIVGGFYQYRIYQNYINASADPDATGPQPGVTSPQAGSSRSLAGYGQAQLKMGNLSAIGAIRYDTDRRFDELRNNAASQIHGTFSAWQPAGTLKYQFSRHFMTYATYGQGFRSGGFNAANLVGPTIGARRVYDKEISKNIEAGIKSDFFDNRVTLNVDIFKTRYFNTQFQRTILVPSLSRYVTSIPKSRVQGVEADLTIRPVPELTITGSLSITDTKITNFDGTSLYVGNPLPNAYHDSEQLSVNYEPRFSDRYRGLFRIDYNRRGPISYSLDNLVNYGPTNYLNLRMGVQTDRWSAAIFVLNATDQRAPEYVLPNLTATASGRYPNQPFRAGIQLDFNIGR